MKNTNALTAPRGHTYTYSDGTSVWSAEPMSESELADHKEYVDAMSEAYEDQLIDADYEPYYTLGAPKLNWSMV